MRLACLLLLALTVRLSAAVDLSGTWAFDVPRIVAHMKASKEYVEGDEATRTRMDQQMAALPAALGVSSWTFGTKAVTMTVGAQSVSMTVTERVEAEGTVTITADQDGKPVVLVITPVDGDAIKVEMGPQVFFFKRKG